MKIQLVSIGNELLNGDTVNTNAAWIGRYLGERGFPVQHVHTVGDHIELLREVLQRCLGQSDIVITTGGLGPTHDDVTKQVLVELLDGELTVHEPTLNFIKEMFEKRDLPFTESNYRQAEVLENSEVLFNKQGTAPGMWISADDVHLAVLPGIPREMKALMKNEVLPKLEDLYPDRISSNTRYLLIAGITESSLSDDLLGGVDSDLDDKTEIAFLPSPEGVKVRISARDGRGKKAEERITGTVQKINKRAGDFIAGEGRDMSLSRAVGDLLRKQNMTISCAESCTGGLLMDMLTDVPGSSDYLAGGIVAYSNEVKIRELQVEKDTVLEHGAVSKEVALQMAKGIADRFDTAIGVSITGIAGPTGGTEAKPVGTVWIGYWSNADFFAVKAILTKKRLLNKKRSAAIALETVRRAVLNVEPMPYGLEKQKS